MNIYDINNFEQKFYAKVTKSPSIDWDYKKAIPSVKITISEKSFTKLLDIIAATESVEWREYEWLLKTQGHEWLTNYLRIVDSEKDEQNLRDSNPALQQAWEEYQLILKLVGGR